MLCRKINFLLPADEDGMYYTKNLSGSVHNNIKDTHTRIPTYIHFDTERKKITN